jgi:hypothetical protein
VRTLSAGRNRVRDAQHWALTLSNGAEAMHKPSLAAKSSWSWYGPKGCECRGSKSTTYGRIVHTQEVKFDERAAQNKVKGMDGTAERFPGPMEPSHLE